MYEQLTRSGEFLRTALTISSNLVAFKRLTRLGTRSRAQRASRHSMTSVPYFMSLTNLTGMLMTRNASPSIEFERKTSSLYDNAGRASRSRRGSLWRGDIDNGTWRSVEQAQMVALMRAVDWYERCVVRAYGDRRGGARDEEGRSTTLATERRVLGSFVSEHSMICRLAGCRDWIIHNRIFMS